MIDFSLQWVVSILLAAAALGLLVSRDWRIVLAFLAAQYIGMFFLVMIHWTLTMSAAKLVTGWMAIAILALTQPALREGVDMEAAWPEGRLFRVFAAGLVLATVFQAAQSVSLWLPEAELPVLWGGLVLIGLGMLQLGITANAFRIITGLLTTLSGFEVLYASVENSILVAALLTVITLGLALLGSFLLQTGQKESAQ